MSSDWWYAILALPERFWLDLIDMIKILLESLGVPASNQ